LLSYCQPTNAFPIRQRSLLFDPTPFGAHDNLGYKDEFSTEVIYATIHMVLRYGECATKRTFVHSILDALLRACLLVLKNHGILH
jgi:hypothetical protein